MASSGGSLLTFVARRLLITVLLLFLISLGVYSLILIIPGNPAIALAGGTKATPAEIAKITAQLHLNEGFFAQYWIWLKAALHGDLGNSLFNNETVASGIAARFPVTLCVAAGGMIVADLDRPARRDPVRAAPGHRPRPAGHRGLERRRGHPRLLAGHAPRHRLRGEAGVASRPRLHAVHPVAGRMVPGPLAAMAGTRHRRLSGHRTPGARRADRHLGPGLHAHRRGQGPQPAHGGAGSTPSRTP